MFIQTSSGSTSRRSTLGLFYLLAALLLASPLIAYAQQAPTPSKIAASVERLLDRIAESRAESATADELAGLSDALLRVEGDGLVELVFHGAGAVGEREAATLVALGGRVVYVLEGFGQVQAWIPAEQVETAAGQTWVVAVTPPDYGEVNTHPANPINSEGVALHNADTAQAQGFDGTGVYVGAISDGVASLAASQARNELPAVTVLNAGSGDEGTAMLEIIHDMAPGATLAFHGTGSGAAGHVTAVQNLVAESVNVIAEDLAYDAQPAFQRGQVATGRENAAVAGVSVHSSSGNRGANHAARVRAVGTGGGPDGVAGPFANCTVQPTNVVAIAPGGDTTFDMVLGTATRFTLQWSEPRAIFPTAGQGGFTNLDLFVMDAGLTRCLYESVGVQANGVGDTIEQIGTVVGNANTAVKVVVNVTGTSSAVAAPLLDLRWRGSASETDTPTRVGSNDPDKNYTGLAWSIGAVDPNGVLRAYSSAGPVIFESTTICPGGAAGPCTGVAGPPPQQFQGLDFLGADGVSVSGVGGFGAGTCPAGQPGGQGDCRFFGTSAAAPHTAGCDAIVRQLVGASADPTEVRAKLASTAVDYAPPGEDPTHGAGRVDCFQALGPPQARCQNSSVNTDPGVCVAANVSVDNGSFDPDGFQVALVQAPAAPYPLGGTAVTLTATDNDGLFDSCVATVTVLDNEPPVLANVPGPIKAEQTDLDGTPVTVPLPTATDNCLVASITSDAPAVFPLGETTVTFTAMDGSGNTAKASTTVTVVDTTPPEINALTASPDMLWPPNHRMWEIGLTVDVFDICDVDPHCEIVAVTSSDPVNATGDGNTMPDWVVTGDLTLSLRAERSAPQVARIYTITVRCTDDSGNSAERDVEVRVPRNRS